MRPGRIVWVAGLALILLAVWVTNAPRRVPPVAETPLDAESEAAVQAQMREVLGRDDILPIYEPRFTGASRARLRDDELMLGVNIRGESKAYDISTLNAREIVVDQLAGAPILVTW